MGEVRDHTSLYFHLYFVYLAYREPATSARPASSANNICQHLPVTSAKASDICQHHLPTSAAHRNHCGAGAGSPRFLLFVLFGTIYAAMASNSQHLNSQHLNGPSISSIPASQHLPASGQHCGVGAGSLAALSLYPLYWGVRLWPARAQADVPIGDPAQLPLALARTIGPSSIPGCPSRDNEAGDILCMKGFCFAWDGD